MSKIQTHSQQSSLDSSQNGGSNSYSQKYTSQPQLHTSHLTGAGGNNRTVNPHRHSGHSEGLTPLSIKTSITLPRQNSTAAPVKKPSENVSWSNHGTLVRQERVQKPDCQAYPDLARHPLSYSQVPPSTGGRNGLLTRYSGVQARYPTQPPNQLSISPIQLGHNSSDDNPCEYEHSRSSSVGDLPLGMPGNDPRMATPDGHASLPYDSTLPTAQVVHNGVNKRTVRHGAVKIDLSFADKSIRRPGSAPDLVSSEEGVNQGETVLRNGKKSGSLRDRGRSTSSEKDSLRKRSTTPGTPATRKVAFAGIEDDEDSESESDKDTRMSGNSVDEEVWVKLPETSKKSEDIVPTSGVVIASGKLVQNKCNGSVNK